MSVVIPTLGRAESLSRALDCLELQSAGTDAFELIVVADAAAPDDGSIEAAIGERAYAARQLRAATPGASAARNLGWREAAAPLVLFTGDDILASAGLLAAHLAAHRGRPGPMVGVLGRVEWARELRVTPFMRWLDRGIQFDFDSIRGENAGWWHLYTANVSLKRAALEEVGGFDETLPFLYEDLDLGKRLAAHGFELAYARDASAEHLHPTSLEDWRKRAAAIAVAERRFVTRHPDFEPYFFNMFTAAEAAPARGILARLAPVIPPSVPRIGPRVWQSADRRYRRELAAPFLDAWRSWEGEPQPEAGGAASSGPK
jgi:GT2 family glycosyltransferase